MAGSLPLSAIFVAHLGVQRDGSIPTEELEQRLGRAAQSAAAAWPALALPPPNFVRHMASLLTKETDPAATLDTLNLPDLYLACACLQAVPGAIEAFEQTVLSRIPAFIGRVDAAPAFADEVRQILCEKLLVGGNTTPPRLAAYSGRGALLKWMRVAAVRTALNLRAQRQRHLQEGRRPELTPTMVDNDPELAYIQSSYRPAFEAAFREALAGLSSEGRNLLRLRFVNDLSIDGIAEVFQVHRATVVRKLARARSDLYKMTEEILQERLGLGSAEFANLAGMIHSQLHISLGRLLTSSLS